MPRPKRRAREPSLAVRFIDNQPPREAFASLVDRLVDGLARSKIRLEARRGGRVREAALEIGRVVSFRPGVELAFAIKPVAWARSRAVTVRVRVGRHPGGTVATLEVDGWSKVIAAHDGGALDWFAGTLLPVVVRELTPASFGDWVTDRLARRPSGAAAVANYRDPTYHWPNFLAILDRLRLTPSDRLLEVACGGGAFLRKALESGCSAVGVDHSPDMLRTARAANADAVASGRLVVSEGAAEHLPVADRRFTCVVCTGAFDFFLEPAGAMDEMFRALEPGGRLALYVGSAALRGTPAAPEPIASRLRFHGPDGLARLARDSGFIDVEVEDPDLEPYARKAGLPKDVVAVFRGTGGGHLLFARKPAGI